ncbi:NAD(P)/FAD-dependent oxidoreductase [Candidatus Aalborgicola defluviihabitans]|mgnify:CR=1 FL=1|uniref:NAD(P)/FAD-dependent oxidoreductase n=1 Tax=Candidatus Aalborgicola defluviihabitans TaxID=3386187 RepID=UPI001EC20F98|nr:oxidoreductase [Burkholderiales bacterium]
MNPVTRTAGIVVIGAGHAGSTLVIELRKLGYEGSVLLLGDEGRVPYQRPPLSKTYLMGASTTEQLTLLSAERMRDLNIEFLADDTVDSIDRAAQTVRLVSGLEISYGQLALTTGGRNRPMSMPGADASNVLPLRTLADADRLRPFWLPGKKLVVIGGGFIGLEAAASANKAGLHITLLEASPHVLSRVTVPEVSRFFERTHRESGVDIRTGAQVTQISHGGQYSEVVLKDGSRLLADCVLTGIGMVPNVELAQEGGLHCDNGIFVDEFARTSDPSIVAAGDCTNHPSAYAGRRLRLESVQNAVDQSRVAAATLVGQRRPYNVVPWFWSDQYDQKFQAVGLSIGYDEKIVRGDLQSRSFSVCYLSAGRLIAVDSVNRVQDHIQARKLIAEKALLDKPRLADVAQKLSDCVS